jgi:dethiobiotin synthetase
MTPLLIVGTDTEVGKTVLTTALVAYWQTYHSLADLGLMKLVQTGVGDRELYQTLFKLSQSPETLAPLCFDTPVAPPVAAEREGRTVDLGRVWQALCLLQQARKFVLVEALGGLGTPVTEELTVADLARDWGLEAILVVPVQLGAIAQAVANVALARQSKVKLKGIVLNCRQAESEPRLDDWTPISLIQSLTQVPILGVLPHLNDPNNLTKLAKFASNLDLERLLPTSRELTL